MLSRDALLALWALPTTSRGNFNSHSHSGGASLKATQQPFTNSAGVLQLFRPFTSVVRNL